MQGLFVEEGRGRSVFVGPGLAEVVVVVVVGRGWSGKRVFKDLGGRRWIFLGDGGDRIGREQGRKDLLYIHTKMKAPNYPSGNPYQQRSTSTTTSYI